MKKIFSLLTLLSLFSSPCFSAQNQISLKERLIILSGIGCLSAGSSYIHLHAACTATTLLGCADAACIGCCSCALLSTTCCCAFYAYDQNKRMLANPPAQIYINPLNPAQRAYPENHQLR